MIRPLASPASLGAVLARRALSLGLLACRFRPFGSARHFFTVRIGKERYLVD